MLRKDLLAASLPLFLAQCTSNGMAASIPKTVDASVQLQSLNRLAAAWNAGDGDAWAAEYWPDGTLVNILGAVFPTATAVASVTNTILAGPFKGSTFAYTVRRVRMVGTAAIIDTDVGVTGFRALPRGAVATQPGLLLTRFIHVFENRNGGWKIEASQNTAVLPQAVAAANAR